jgi:hypothetical protein
MAFPKFNTSKYDNFENPAPEAPPKRSGLSAIEAVDPYAVLEKTAVASNAALWEAKKEALRNARTETPDKMERISQALLAFGAPTGGNNWAALSNAAKSLSMSGKLVSDAERERANQLAQIEAQRREAEAAIRERYGLESAKARHALTLKGMEGTEIVMSGPRNDIPIYKTGPRAGQSPAGYQAPPAGTYDNKPTTLTSAGGRSVEGWTDPKGNFTPYPKEPKEAPTADEVAAATERAAKAREVGQAAGVAQSALSGAKTNVNSTMALIEKLESHKGLDAVIGLPNPMKGGWGIAQVPGSDAADFKTDLDNLTGKMFIAAFESLKGGGAISEKEGEAATRAIANLSKSQSGKQFRQNLAILKQTLANGYATLEQKAKGSAGSAPTAPETKTLNGVTYEKRGNDWYAK